MSGTEIKGMKDPKCIKCRGLKYCRDENTSWIIIFIGFIATVAVRAVTILMNVDPILGKAAWYVGVSGFIVFFL